MKSFTSLTLILSALTYVAASPIQNRASTVQCSSEPLLSHTLSFTGSDFAQHGSVSTAYFGTDDAVMTTDSKGNRVPVLISQKADGSTFTEDNAPLFDFIICQSSYMGTPSTHELYSAGHITPHGDPTKCLQTKSGSVKTHDQVMVIADCSFEESSEQQQMFFEYFERHPQLTFLATRRGENQHTHVTHFSLSGVNHKALKLNAGRAQYPFENQQDYLNY